MIFIHVVKDQCDLIEQSLSNIVQLVVPFMPFLTLHFHMCNVTLSHLRSKAQAVVHNLCTTLVVDHNIHTIPTGIHHQQQHNKPATTLECN